MIPARPQSTSSRFTQAGQGRRQGWRQGLRFKLPVLISVPQPCLHPLMTSALSVAVNTGYENKVNNPPFLAGVFHTSLF